MEPSSPPFESKPHRNVRLSVVNPSSRYYRIRRRLSKTKGTPDLDQLLSLGACQIILFRYKLQGKNAHLRPFLQEFVSSSGLGYGRDFFTLFSGLLRTFKMIQLKLLSTVR